MKNFIKKHKQQTIVAASILILLVVTIGTSFAFFNYAKKGTTENSIKLGEITFKYTENGTNGNGITITDAFPISDEEGRKLKKYKETLGFYLIVISEINLKLIVIVMN